MHHRYLSIHILNLTINIYSSMGCNINIIGYFIIIKLKNIVKIDANDYIVLRNNYYAKEDEREYCKRHV